MGPAGFLRAGLARQWENSSAQVAILDRGRYKLTLGVGLLAGGQPSFPKGILAAGPPFRGRAGRMECSASPCSQAARRPIKERRNRRKQWP
jgi:hypothetical protein